MLTALRRLQDAVNANTSAVRLDANLSTAWTKLGKTLLNAGQARDAADCFERMFALGKADIETAMSLAKAYRFDKRPDDAIALYDNTIAVHSSNGEAYRMRAACRMQKTAQLQDRASAAPLIAQVREDYRRANELEPDNEQGRLDPIEVDVCRGDPGLAFELVRTSWPTPKQPYNRMIGAWLSAIAALLAGRPESDWAEYRRVLEPPEPAVPPDDWSVVEIGALLERLRADPGFDPSTLAKIDQIHRFFLGHFPEQGPAIR